MEHFYEVMEEIFNNKNDSRHSSRFILGLQIIIGVAILSQNVQMFWYFSIEIQDWNRFKVFWDAISLPSLDNVAVSYNFVSAFTIGILSAVSACIFFFFQIFVFRYMKWKIPSIIIFLTRNLLRFLCEIYFISTIRILLAIIKYSSPTYNTVVEYSTDNSVIFNFGVGGMVSSIFLLTIVIIFTTFYNATSSDVRQPLNDKITIAKSRTTISQLTSCIYFITTLMYFFIGYDYYQLYLFALIVLYGIIAWYYIYYLPFYNETLNWFKIFIHLDCVIMIIAFWIGYQLNNAGVPFLIALIMQIVLLTVSYSIMKYRISSISTDYQAFNYKFSSFELSVRKYLKSGELEEEIITQMNKNFNIYRDKLNLVMQAYYCSDVLLNDGLAYNKIIGVKYKGFNIFTNFQVYKCKKTIISQCSAAAIEGIQLYQYFTDLEKLKLDDFNLCEKYSKFSQAILEPNPNLSKLKNYIDELFDDKKVLIKSYESILEKFPNSEEVNDMYGSFLIAILCDINKGKLYLNKIIKSSNSANASKLNFTKINDRGFLIFSGNLKNIGKIIYANKSFIKYISIPADLIKTYFFANFLPRSFSRDHTILLKHFIKNYTESIIYKSLPLFLVNYNGYLCEFFISLECIGDKDSINFLCSIDPIYSGKRELAVIDLNGYIYSHSKDFVKILGYDHKNAENMNIEYYIADIIISELNFDVTYEVKQTMPNEHTSKTIGIMLKCCKINEITIYVLFITDDADQIYNWKIGTNFYDIEGINYKYFITEDQEIEKIEQIEEKKEIRAATKSLLQLPDENNQILNKIEDKNTSVQSKQDAHSNTDTLDNTGIKAAGSSRTVLRVTRVLLFVSVSYI